MRWLELSVEADIEAVEAVSEILGRIGGGGTAVHPTRLLRDPDDELAAREDPEAPFRVVAHVEDGPSAAEAVERTERALWHLQAFGLRPVGELRVRPVDDADWTDSWKRHYVPQRIGRVVIVPSWIDHVAEPDDAVVRLDPGMAFGTGVHPTTRGCLELLQELSPMPDRLLDVGCGSGILALAALRLGAGSAVCLDTDPLAVEATIANAARNGLGANLTAAVGTLPEQPAERYPLVLANLVAAVITDLATRLAAHLAPGGVLLASGIIAPKAGSVLDALATAGLRSHRRLDDGDWVSLILGRAA